jgi:hypothetical protein
MVKSVLTVYILSSVTGIERWLTASWADWSPVWAPRNVPCKDKYRCALSSTATGNLQKVILVISFWELGYRKAGIGFLTLVMNVHGEVLYQFVKYSAHHGLGWWWLITTCRHNIHFSGLDHFQVHIVLQFTSVWEEWYLLVTFWHRKCVCRICGAHLTNPPENACVGTWSWLDFWILLLYYVFCNTLSI